ncbi:DNA excision repair protein ERCC-6-like [Patiria miniata]|uniref:DNA excision repair protein ERCC-6 n=1 Tax=Patiria miniata TaxID=46514 RepID=A0A914AW46_PATMI|nr:DNA excision repair protein ERCC-6-like [Patiria miniata]
MASSSPVAAEESGSTCTNKTSHVASSSAEMDQSCSRQDIGLPAHVRNGFDQREQEEEPVQKMDTVDQPGVPDVLTPTASSTILAPTTSASSTMVSAEKMQTPKTATNDRLSTSDHETPTASSLIRVPTTSPSSKTPSGEKARAVKTVSDKLSTSEHARPTASSWTKHPAGESSRVIASGSRDMPSTSKKDIFSVDTSLIPSVPGQLQATELQGLEGVSVFNQEEFERGVMEQVDQAITVRQKAVDRERAEKDLDRVLTDIRSCKKELGHLDRAIALANAKSLTSPVTFAQKEVQRNIISMRTKRDNKAKQLKTLRARQRSLLAKLSGSDVAPQVSEDDGDDEERNVETYQHFLCSSPSSDGIPSIAPEETEQERLIRLGEMTPFGSTVQSKASTSKATTSTAKPAPRPMTDFEKFMVQKTEEDMTRRKKVVVRKKTPIKSKPESVVPTSSEKKTQAGQSSGKMFSSKTKASSKTEGKKVKEKSRKHKPEVAKKKSVKDSSQRKEGAASDSSDDGTYFVYKPVRSESSSYPKAHKRRRKARDLRPHWGSDEEMSDYCEDSAGSDEDYTPGFDDFSQPSDEDDEYSSPLQKKANNRGRKPKVSTEDFEDGTIACLDDLKRAYGVNVKRSSSHRKSKCKDDATQDMYYRRLKEHRRSELLKKQRRIEQGVVDSDSEPEDMQFDGGFTVPGKMWSNLYKYQKVGVKWLWELHQQQAGGIVGDEMGLGKTIQMIVFFAGLKASKVRNPGSRYIGVGPVLIVCPATVMHQWVKEYHKWMPEMRVAVLHDSGSHTGTKRALIHDIALSHGTLVTSYSGVRIQEELLLKHDWHYIVLDEGHKIRNPDAAVTQSCKQFRTCHRIILSGSPMQNNLRELWSLIDFVFPGKLGTLPVFMEQFSVPITIGGYSNATQVQVQTAYKCATVLRDTINPYLLRRMKADVKQSLQLPDKNEQVLFCRLSEEQTELYKEYLNSKECQLILNREYQVFAGLITLRKICNHPDLVSGGPKIIKGDQSAEAVLAANDPKMQYGYWERCGKMIVVNSLLKLWHKQGHRVLLFSQSKQMLDIMEDFVKHTYSYMRMDGSTSISSRQPLIQQYNSDPSIFVFLLTTRVGGLGVNLTGANRVVIFDPDWNPSTDTQARERAWRIGQNRQVTIYRLITNGTIEEKIYHRQIFKQFLTNRVLKDPRQRRFFKSNDLFELFTLGSDSSNHGTETSAIFAGVGSDVKVRTAARPSPPRKKSVEKTRGERREDGESRKRPSNKKTEDDAEKKTTLEDAAGCSQSLSNASQDSPGPSRINRGAESPEVAKERPSESTEPPKPNATSSPSKNGSLHKVEKKRKKRKDARLDGHRIAHLAKHAAYRPKTDKEEKPAQTDAQQDDYVLTKLLKKSGVHSALQHDSIMQAGHPDYLLVEGEADRVARDAVQALRQSRRHCHRASSGVPTWTGSRNQGGSTPPPKKPRFGQKSNNKVAGLLGGSKIPKDKDKQQKQASATPTPKPQHFSGTELIETAASKTSTKTATLPSSQSLLSQMRKRNSLTTASDPDSVAGSSTDQPQRELLSDIRDFVAFQAGTPGQASTAEILGKFQAKLPPNDSALFKSMLKEICQFQRVDGGGVWRLKEDFR